MNDYHFNDRTFEGYPEPLDKAKYMIPPALQYSGHNPHSYSSNDVAHIESCITSASSLITTYDKSVLHLKDLLRRLEADRAHLIKYRHDYKSIVNSPIRRIPEEVLSLIFSFVVSMSENSDLVNAAGTIMHHRLPNALLVRVCRHWRHVALHTPVLWSRIELELQNVNWWEAPKLAGAVRLFKRYLELSRKVGLTLVVHFPIDGIGSGGKTQGFVDLMCAEAERWQDVWFESVTREDIGERLEAKVKGRLGMLEKLRIFVQKDARRILGVNPAPLAGASAPVKLDFGKCSKLKVLEWKGLSLALPDELSTDDEDQERMEQLETVQLECNAPRDRPCDLPVMLCGVLPRTPLLHTLRVKCQHQHSHQEEMDPSFSHLSSNITTFSMTNTSAPLIDMLTLPQLKSIGFAAHSSRTMLPAFPSSFERFLARSGCSITHLSLTSNIAGEADSLDGWAHIRRLLHDSVHALHLSGLGVTGGEDRMKNAINFLGGFEEDLETGHLSFPHLRVVFVTDIAPKSIDAKRLMSVIEKRIPTLKQVMLPPALCPRASYNPNRYRSPSSIGSSSITSLWVKEMNGTGCMIGFDTPNLDI